MKHVQLGLIREAVCQLRHVKRFRDLLQALFFSDRIAVHDLATRWGKAAKVTTHNNLNSRSHRIFKAFTLVAQTTLTYFVYLYIYIYIYLLPDHAS